jgi:membrane protease YdiL (CAAX protease family)
MHRLTEWIKKHALITFFVLTFAITWGLGFSYRAVIQQGNYLLAPVAFVATCSPALAGILIASITNTQPRQGSRKSFWAASLVAWVLAAGVFIAHNRLSNPMPLSAPALIVILVAVLPVALVISMAYSTNPAVRTLVAPLLRLRGVGGWALLALALPLACIVLASLVSKLLGRYYLVSSQLPDADPAMLGRAAITFVYQLFFFNATGEEVGWRGFALPRFQARVSPLVASLILGLFWSPWHFFLWQAEGRPVLSPPFWGERYYTHILATLLIVWLFNRSRGSILVAGVIHAAANTVFAFFPRLDWPVYNGVMVVLVAALIVGDRMWRRLPAEHPAVYRPPDAAA